MRICWGLWCAAWQTVAWRNPRDVNARLMSFASRRWLRYLIGAYLALSLPFIALFALSERLQLDAGRLILQNLFEWRPAVAILCGDSNVAGLPDRLPRAAWGWGTVMNLAVPGATVFQILPQVDAAMAMSTRHVIVMAGTNDLARNSDDDILNAWGALFALRSHRNPPTIPARPRMVIVSIPLQSDAAMDKRIHRLNQRLEAMANRYHWRFVDANTSVFRPDLPREQILIDQVHFSTLGYRHWFEVVASSVASK